MNKKIKIFILGFAIISGLLVTSVGPVSASARPSCNNVTFNGSVTPNGNTTTVWFEWGTTPSLGTETARQTFSSDSNFSQFVTNLTANTTYYYRAMAQNSVGTATGDTVSFTTTSSCASNAVPTVTITADNTNLNYNGSTTVRWTSNNADQCQAS